MTTTPPEHPRPAFDLTGRIAVVTGGANGLGAGAAAALARHGATVVVLDLDGQAAQQAAESFGPDSVGLACDVSAHDDVAAAFARIADSFGRVDVLMNSAGISFSGRGDAPPDEIDLDLWHRILAVNLHGTFHATRHALPLMITGGSVINMASIAGPVLGGRSYAYGASKGAVIAMTKSLAVTHGPRRIRVNAIAPGSMNTRMAEFVKSSPEATARFIDRVPLQRMGEVEDIAGLVVYLASDESSFFTGNVLVLDGALTLA